MAHLGRARISVRVTHAFHSVVDARILALDYDLSFLERENSDLRRAKVYLAC